MPIRVQAVYRGDVQGVGFRATAAGQARGLHVHGSVRNQPDGTVQLVAEGEAEQVNELLDRVAAAMRHHIQHVDTVSLPVTGDTGGFRIAF